MKTLIASPAYYPSKRLPNDVRIMLQSAKNLGITVDLIGLDMPFTGLKSKIDHFMKVVSKINFDVVIMLDACDTVIAAPIDEFEIKYREMGAGFIMSAEANCYPNYDGESDRHPYPEHKWRFLNSGFFMATHDDYIKTYLDLINSKAYYDPKLKNNDQSIWMHAFLDKEINIKLDYGCQLSQCMIHNDCRPDNSQNTEFEWGKRPWNKLESSYPCSFHHNGTPKIYYHPMLKLLETGQWGPLPIHVANYYRSPEAIEAVKKATQKVRDQYFGRLK